MKSRPSGENWIPGNLLLMEKAEFRFPVQNLPGQVSPE
jgi:hypothetical protein